jgi:hypothetical protein
MLIRRRWTFLTSEQNMRTDELSGQYSVEEVRQRYADLRGGEGSVREEVSSRTYKNDVEVLQSGGWVGGSGSVRERAKEGIVFSCVSVSDGCGVFLKVYVT